MLTSYSITRELSKSNPVEELRREKNIQLHSLYEFAADREENVYWSDGISKKSFKKSPRLFDVKYIDSVHTRMTVETICKEDRFVTGDYIYIEDDGCYWLCLNSHMFHGMYCRGLFQKCNYTLRWQNRTTLKIIERPAIVLNATKYGVGQDFGQQVEIPTSSRQIQVRYDEETILLDSPIRFFLDWNKKHPTAYIITQNDNTSVHYGNGIINIVCQDSEYNIVKDDIDHWICDYIDPSKINDVGCDNTCDNNYCNNCPIDEYTASIIGRDDLRINDSKPYYAKILNYGKLINNEDINYSWNITSCDFPNDIKQEIIDGKLYLTIMNSQCIGKTFELQLLINDLLFDKMTINIVDVY